MASCYTLTSQSEALVLQHGFGLDADIAAELSPGGLNATLHKQHECTADNAPHRDTLTRSDLPAALNEWRAHADGTPAMSANPAECLAVASLVLRQKRFHSLVVDSVLAAANGRKRVAITPPASRA